MLNVTKYFNHISTPVLYEVHMLFVQFGFRFLFHFHFTQSFSLLLFLGASPTNSITIESTAFEETVPKKSPATELTTSDKHKIYLINQIRTLGNKVNPI